MTSDFDYGRQLAVTLAPLRPLDKQRFLNLLNDVLGSEVNLAGAFQMLLRHSLFVSAFLGRAQSISNAQFLALLDVARDCLSEELLVRLEKFLQGYCSSLDPSFVPPASTTQLGSDFKSQLDSSPAPAAYVDQLLDPRTVHDASDLNATVLVDLPSQASAVGAHSMSAAPGVQSVFPANPVNSASSVTPPPQQKLSAFVLIGLFVAVIVVIPALGFAAFRLTGICAAFNVCGTSETKPKSNDESSPQNKGNDRRLPVNPKPSAGSAPSPGGTPLPSGSSGQSQESSANPARATPAPPLVQLSPPPAPQVPYQPPSAPASGGGAPLREEPLW